MPVEIDLQAKKKKQKGRVKVSDKERKYGISTAAILACNEGGMRVADGDDEEGPRPFIIIIGGFIAGGLRVVMEGDEAVELAASIVLMV